MNLQPLIDENLRRFEELDREVSRGDLYQDAENARRLLREHARLREILALWRDLEKVRGERDANRALIDEADAEMAELAAE